MVSVDIETEKITIRKNGRISFQSEKSASGEFTYRFENPDIGIFNPRVFSTYKRYPNEQVLLGHFLCTVNDETEGVYCSRLEDEE